MDVHQSMGTFRDSVEAFGDAAMAETTRTDIDFDQASKTISALYDRCKTEIGRMSEAYSRRPWSIADHMACRQVADHSLVTLDAIYQGMRTALANWHGKD